MAGSEDTSLLTDMPILLPTRGRPNAPTTYGEATVAIIPPTRGSYLVVTICGKAHFSGREVSWALLLSVREPTLISCENSWFGRLSGLIGRTSDRSRANRSHP